MPEGVDPEASCLRRAVFGDRAESLYVLPFSPGEFYWISQSYCLAAGGHRNQLAYDFTMAVGTDILAARAGTVIGVKEDSPDNGLGNGRHNFVFIRHEDGTVAFYAHLMQDGVVIETGDEVAGGEVIALSGNSGLTGGPYLHFGLYQSAPTRKGLDVPVNFRNADGRLDPRGGLLAGFVYEALPDD